MKKINRRNTDFLRDVRPYRIKILEGRIQKSQFVLLCIWYFWIVFSVHFEISPGTFLNLRTIVSLDYFLTYLNRLIKHWIYWVSNWISDVQVSFAIFMSQDVMAISGSIAFFKIFFTKSFRIYSGHVWIRCLERSTNLCFIGCCSSLLYLSSIYMSWGFAGISITINKRNTLDTILYFCVKCSVVWFCMS